MRVGLRRLRAAMSLFKPFLHDRQTAAIKTELKWLAGELGPARELEVLVNRVVAPMKRQGRRWRGMPSLSQELAERRDAARTRAYDAVQSARFRALTVDLAAWLQAGLWTNPHDDLVQDRGDLPIATFAVEQLTRCWRKVRKRGKALAHLDARSRHMFRIQTKKLRYTTEFFATLFTTRRAVKRRKQFLPALERLQDGLGDLNDISVHESGNGQPPSANQPEPCICRWVVDWPRRRTARSCHDGCDGGVRRFGQRQTVLALIPTQPHWCGRLGAVTC
jgi:CHAD domain-containing protein